MQHGSNELPWRPLNYLLKDDSKRFQAINRSLPQPLFRSSASFFSDPFPALSKLGRYCLNLAWFINALLMVGLVRPEEHGGSPQLLDALWETGPPPAKRARRRRQRKGLFCSAEDWCRRLGDASSCIRGEQSRHKQMCRFDLRSVGRFGALSSGIGSGGGCAGIFALGSLYLGLMVISLYVALRLYAPLRSVVSGWVRIWSRNGSLLCCRVCSVAMCFVRTVC